jgi:hypothetical protein
MGKGDRLEATADYDAAADESLTDGAPDAAGMAAAGLPDRIGRYRIERVLGKGVAGVSRGSDLGTSYFGQSRPLQLLFQIY